MEAYCVKCKEKGRSTNHRPFLLPRDANTGDMPGVRPKLFRMGRTEAHGGLTAPPKGSRKGVGDRVITCQSARWGVSWGKLPLSFGGHSDSLRSQPSGRGHDFEPKYRAPKRNVKS
jgi:hypothetical protein